MKNPDTSLRDTEPLVIVNIHDDPELKEIQDMVRACMQCGTCTASCPNSTAMDYTPRSLWRMLLFGETDKVLESKTMFTCSSCYTCTLRCPRGLPLTEAMAALKSLAMRRGGPRRGTFYKAFADNVRKYGRVQETALMVSYFMRSKNPLLPLSYTGVGLRLLSKGKMGPPHKEHAGKLDHIFAGPPEAPVESGESEETS